MANFTPAFDNYTNVKPFRYWVQTVIPLVYDDSLSYMELLAKVVDYLNKVIEDNQAMIDNIDALLEAYNQLQEYVNDYFDNLDVQEEIDNKLDRLVTEGTLTELIEPFIPDVVADWLSEHITPTSPPIDKTLTISNAGADAKVVGDNIDAINYNLRKYNSTNYLNVGVVAQGTSAGITYSNNNGIFKAQGTATSRFVFNYYNDVTKLPKWVNKGETYKVKINQTGLQTGMFNLQVRMYENNTDYLSIFDSAESGEFTIPNDDRYVGMIIRITVPSGSVVDNTFTVEIKNTKSNYELSDDIDIINKILENYNSINVLPEVTDTQNTVAGVSYTWEDNVFTAEGTASGTFYYNFWSGLTLPDWIKHGETYIVNLEQTGNSENQVNLDIRAYKTQSNYTRLYNSKTSGKFTMPADESYIGILIRFTVASGTVVDTTAILRILNAKSNKQLTNDIENIYVELDNINDELVDILNKPHKNSVRLYNNDNNYYVRTVFDETTDFITFFQYPNYRWNFNFNYIGTRLIPTNTPDDYESVVSAYESADVYKPCGDDIGTFMCNGNGYGGNHGNPNFIKVNASTHGLTIGAIGSVWSDGTNNYTLVQVYNSYLIFGSVSGGELIVRNPQTLTNSTYGTITPSSSDSYELRPSIIKEQFSIVNESGTDVKDGGYGTFIKVIEEYDVVNQAKMLNYLQANAGNCNNESYHSDSIPYLLYHVINEQRFNRNGSITVNTSTEVKDSFNIDYIYSGMSGYFGASNTGYDDSAYVPDTTNLNTITTIPDNETIYPEKSGTKVPYRYYQLSNNNKGFFTHLINGLGDTNQATRSQFSPTARFSFTAEKFYSYITRNTDVNVGDKFSWCYARGPYKYDNNIVNNTAFDLGDSFIVAIDVLNSYSGYVKIPEYMEDMKIEVLDKTDSVTLLTEYSTGNGIKFESNGAGYLVVRLS